jgi:hypothetical protein
MLDPESRNTWRTNWIDSLEFFADRTFQEDLWSGKVKSAIDCYPEAISAYFDQLNLQDDYEWALQEALLSNEEFDAVKDFHEKLVKYTPPNEDPWNYRAILKDSNWYLVCDAAKEALEKL